MERISFAFTCRQIHQRGVEYQPTLILGAVNAALKQLFGSIGGAVLFEVLDCDSASGKATITADARWAAAFVRCQALAWQPLSGRKTRRCSKSG